MCKRLIIDAGFCLPFRFFLLKNQFIICHRHLLRLQKNYLFMLMIAPYFGYLASLFLVIALLVSNDLKFRWFNTAGNVTFIIYALILSAFPVLLTNTILLAINVTYLYKVYNRIEDFELIEFKGEEKMVNKFLQFHKADISNYFPTFSPEAIVGSFNFVVLRDLVIANMFSAKITADGDAEVLINYTHKKYRDFKVGRFIFDKEKQFLISKGVKRVVYNQPISKSHQKFLNVMGFVKELRNGKEYFIKQL